MFNEDNTNAPESPEIEAMILRDTIQIGMTHKEASALLPQVVTPSGTIKKYPNYTRDRSEKSTINIARMAVRAMDAFAEGDAPTITLFMPAGIIDLNPELAFYFEANEMWSDLAAKGWRFEVGK